MKGRGLGKNNYADNKLLFKLSNMNLLYASPLQTRCLFVCLFSFFHNTRLSTRHNARSGAKTSAIQRAKRVLD